jgi:hypothetical protein
VDPGASSSEPTGVEGEIEAVRERRAGVSQGGEDRAGLVLLGRAAAEGSAPTKVAGRGDRADQLEEKDRQPRWQGTTYD